MRINYFLPFISMPADLADEAAVVVGQVERLRERGHDVTLTIPRSQPAEAWENIEYVRVIETPDQMPDAEAIVAAGSHSVPVVSQMPPSKGAPFYLVGDYESLWAGNVDWTYRAPIRKIVGSKWLAGVMRESFGQDSVVVPPPVDHDVFRPKTGDAAAKRVLVMDHYVRVVKGVRVAAEAVALARRKVPDLKLVVFGVEPRDAGFGRVAEVQANPTGKALADLYRSCDVFLYPALSDGNGLVALQAMACGTAVVTTDGTGMGDWASDEVCYVAPVHDVAVTAERLVEALTDDERRARVAEGGKRLASEFSWEKTIDGLEAAFGGEAGDAVG